MSGDDSPRPYADRRRLYSSDPDALGRAARIEEKPGGKAVKHRCPRPQGHLYRVESQFRTSLTAVGVYFLRCVACGWIKTIHGKDLKNFPFEVRKF